jgi:hypothetical protein
MTDLGWGPSLGENPFPPANVQVVSPLFTGALDIRWDDPRINPCNSVFSIVGVNIYRSDTTERGPYTRINRFPVGGNFYRDLTDNALAEQEVVHWPQDYISRGESANGGRFTFKTKRCPIVKKDGQAITANSPADVQVTINGVIVPVHEVFGTTGEITLINTQTFDIARQRLNDPILPDENSIVTITYYYNRNLVKQDLDQKLWYRVTTVAACVDENGNPLTSSGLIETPLKFAPAITNHQIETMDYIWREAIRRNNWVLEQGGERVKIFIRKTSGIPCFCGIDARTLEIGQQPRNKCEQCFGVGFVGGYEGPYDLIISPDDGADRRVRQDPSGRVTEHQWEVWTGPSPALTQRDFVVRQTNERYSIGAVRKPSARGNIMQQHFSIKYLEEGDIRYEVPMADPAGLTWPECRIMPPTTTGGAWRAFPPFGPHPVGEQATIPNTTDKENIPDEREIRGRTAVWENITY